MTAMSFDDTRAKLQAFLDDEASAWLEPHEIAQIALQALDAALALEGQLKGAPDTSRRHTVAIQRIYELEDALDTETWTAQQAILETCRAVNRIDEVNEANEALQDKVFHAEAVLRSIADECDKALGVTSVVNVHLIHGILDSYEFPDEVIDAGSFAPEPTDRQLSGIKLRYLAAYEAKVAECDSLRAQLDATQQQASDLAAVLGGYQAKLRRVLALLHDTDGNKLPGEAFQGLVGEIFAAVLTGAPAGLEGA
jgi:hypothetical protein